MAYCANLLVLLGVIKSYNYDKMQLMENSFVPKTRDDLFLLANLFIVARAVHIMADYPIADYLLEKPKSYREIARRFDFDETAMHKLLRVLSSFDIFSENQDETFSITDVGRYFCHSHPESVKDFLFCDESRWNPFGRMDTVLKTGLPAFNDFYQKSYFGYLTERPALQEQFDRHMLAVSSYEDQILAKELPLKENDHFMDIGGGAGGLVEAALQKHPSATAVLFDLPEVINAISTKLDERITPLKGSFFKPINAQCDTAILKRVLHDWNDKECVQILSNAKNTLRPGGKLLIIETILEGPKDPQLTRIFDLLLLTLFGGRERYLQDYQDLLKRSGMKLSQVLTTDCSMSIIIADNHHG